MNEVKKRHGCLSSVLILLVVSSLLTSVIISIYGDKIAGITTTIIILNILAVISELVFIYLIFKWKKIGFYGLIMTYLFNLYIVDKVGNLDISTVLGICLRVGLLYFALQIKKKGVSGWQNMTD